MRIALVTGASSGLGREFLYLLEAQYQIDEIWGIGRNRKALEELQQDLHTDFRPLIYDLTQQDSFAALQQLLEKETPTVEIVINAAGFGKIGFWQDISLEDSAAMIDLNCKAAVLVTQLVIPYMAKHGKILEICSVAGFQPLPYINIYAASKAFLYHYSCALHNELQKEQIIVTAVCPYWIKDTKFIEIAQMTDKENYITNFMMASHAKNIAKKALRDAELGYVVSTPDSVSAAANIFSKILPINLMMKIWNVLRRKEF